MASALVFDGYGWRWFVVGWRRRADSTSFHSKPHALKKFPVGDLLSRADSISPFFKTARSK